MYELAYFYSPRGSISLIVEYGFGEKRRSNCGRMGIQSVQISQHIFIAHNSEERFGFLNYLTFHSAN